MAWEQIGTYEGIPFWADDSLGVTDGDVTSNYIYGIRHEKACLEAWGETASQAFLKDGRVFVVPAEVKDYPGFCATSGFLSQDLPNSPDL